MAMTAEDYIGMFDGEDAELPDQPLAPQPASATKQLQTSQPEQVDQDDWQDDPVPVKLEKIRAAFLNAYSAAEVIAKASLMPFGDWVELVVKLSPKNVQVTGGLSFQHLMADLGPIDKELYRPQPKAIEAEFSEVKEK